MKINYEKIVTRDLTSLISEEQLASLKAEAKIERNRIKYYNKSNIMDLTIQSRAEERVYLAGEYQKKNSIEKAILLANIVFDDNLRFTEMLLRGKYDRRILESYIKLLEYLKCKRAYYDLEETDLQYEKKCNVLASRIAKHVSIYIGPIKPEIIINKINEILSFCPELLETNKEHKTK